MAKHTRVGTAAGNADELECYLMDGCIPAEDPLQWWIMNQKVYPNLAKLAISVHCIPGAYHMDFFMYISDYHL
jgi:hypothetical protein